MEEYLVSKDWDCQYTFEELLKYEGSYIKFVINYSKHGSDNCYDRFILLFNLPEITNYEDTKYLQVGIKDDGFVYIGDQDYINADNTSLIKTDEAIKFMMSYKEFINSKNKFERELMNRFNEDCINIIYDCNYNLQYKYGKDLTFIPNKYR